MSINPNIVACGPASNVLQRPLRWLVTLFAAVFAVFFVSTAHAAKFTPPPLNGHVVDGTGTLTREQIAALDTELTSLREATGFAIVVFIAPSLEGYTIEDVAYDTFNTWQIGEKQKDNGVLLVMAPNERRSRIETGKGVGGELTDLESIEILRNHVTPAMKQGDLFQAASAGSQAIATALTGDLPPSERRAPPAREAPPISPVAKWVMFLAVAALIVLSIVSPTARWILLGILQSFLFMRGGGGRGGGGGGGYSGGGGRSGGGGASDSY